MLLTCGCSAVSNWRPGPPAVSTICGYNCRGGSLGKKCHFDYQGRQIKKTSCRTKDHQRERVLFPSAWAARQEGLHHDWSAILRDRRTTSTGQGGRSLPNDKMELRKTNGGTNKHGQDSTVRFTRGYLTFRMRPFVN